jgi:uncharacterized SAM-binding protein YcdF (DUF218 family)
MLLLVGALVSPRRFNVSVAFLSLYLFGAPVTADLLLGSLENRYPRRAVEACPRSDAIFVFGGMLSLRDYGSSKPEWNGEADRFEESIALYNSRKAPLVVFSGGPERYQGGPDEGEILRDEAIRRGLPESAILVTHKTWNTESEAANLCFLVKERNRKRVLVVTSAYHMARALLESARCQGELIAVPAAYLTPAPNTSWALQRPEYFLPQARALSNSEIALHEYWGMWSYRMSHRPRQPS